jgi:hypothetical protein
VDVTGVERGSEFTFKLWGTPRLAEGETKSWIAATEGENNAPGFCDVRKVARYSIRSCHSETYRLAVALLERSPPLVKSLYLT